jgi:hypothetical protein
MREITKCKLCKQNLKLFRLNKKCVNLGCTEYNKLIRRRVNVRKTDEKRQEEE